MGKGRGGLPDRWLDYIAVGKPIKGVPILACKVPLKEEMLRHKLEEHQWFTPDMLMQSVPNLGCVVDLTATNRYYNPIVFTERGIRHEKIFCAGHVIPSPTTVQRFFQVLDDFLHSVHTQGKFLAVHCTHGLNRTGYLVSRYMVERRGIQPADAITAFNDARGHHIERGNYIDHLRGMSQQVCPNPMPLHKPRGNNGEDLDLYRPAAASIEPPVELNWRQRAAMAAANPVPHQPYQYSSSVNQLLQRSNPSSVPDHPNRSQRPVDARTSSNRQSSHQRDQHHGSSWSESRYRNQQNNHPNNDRYRVDHRNPPPPPPARVPPPPTYREQSGEPPSHHSHRHDNQSQWRHRPNDQSDRPPRDHYDRRPIQSRPSRPDDYKRRDDGRREHEVFYVDRNPSRSQDDREGSAGSSRRNGSQSQLPAAASTRSKRRKKRKDSDQQKE